MTKRPTAEGRATTMCKQSPPGSPAASLLAKETPVDGGAAAATYTAFLDALLTNVCCADKGTSDLDTDSTKDFAVGGRSDGVVSGGGNVDVSADRGSRPLSSSTGNGGDGNNKSTINDVINNNDHTITEMDHKEPLAESILSHLRFNPLLSSSSNNRRGDDNNLPTSTSSLDEFFDLFLRDDAPHSFLSFHKSKGDKEIKATPWKIGQTEDRLERTITFITKFTPKNLQEPEQEKEVAVATPSSTKTITDISNNPDISNPTLTLAVTSHQTLSRRPSTMILESLFSFDFVNDSIHKTSLTKMLNLSLTQFLISNDVKGSEVNVRVVLKEGDGGVNSTTDKATTARGEQQVIHPFLLPDRLIPSLSEDPLSKSILDVNDHDGNSNNKNNYKDGGSGCNNVMEENPSCIGASLLSAIRARNCPTPPKSRPKSRTSKRNSSPVDEAALLIAKHSESITPNNRKKKQDLLPPLLQKRDIADDTTYDVLRTASSRGSLKFKQVSSFEAGVNPGEMAMRRMLWEKDRSGGIGRGGNGNNTVLRRDETNTTSEEDDPSSSSSSLLLPFNLSPREGLSMHIEMEVRDSSNSSSNNTSSLRHRSSSLSNSSFPRTRSNGVGGPSIAYIEEKVRKGLKKRVARSWITWANSWCMRLWEEEQMERFLRKGSSSPITRRRSTNTRPTVRRVGEKKKSPARGGVIAKKQQTAAPNNNNNVEMDKLTVMQRQIQLAESMKAISSRRVVTPTSSPIRETNNESSVWSPLMVKNGNHSCRWMSSDEEEGQCGVEVRTITPVKSREGGGRSTPMKKIIRGLRSKSVTRA